MARPAPGHHPPARPTPPRPARQVSLWADLLDDLDHGEPAISTSASEMAADVPAGLRRAVNKELARRGCRFRIET
ncbi:MAG: hypothetical protein VKL97_06615 [Cyanobacteriota bacterium]|nr:hypothetical protein [Cyanobacteriota bacterium]